MLDAQAVARSIVYKDINCNFNTITNFTLSCFSNEHGLNLYCFTQVNKCIICIYWSILWFAVSSSTDSKAKCVVWLALSTCSKLGASSSRLWSNAGSSMAICEAAFCVTCAVYVGCLDADPWSCITIRCYTHIFEIYIHKSLSLSNYF